MEITDLKKELNNGTNEFIEKIIQISGNGLFINENSLMFISSLSFHDCIFKGTHLEFENINMPEFYLGFFNCSFEISLDIKNCNFKRLGFRDTKSNKSVNISVGHFSNFFFRNNSLNEKNKIQLKGNISICNLTIDERIELDYINHTNGEFNFSNNNLCNSESENKDKVITFENSTFKNAKFINSKFLIETSFEKMQIIQNCEFDDCEFEKVNFSNLILGKINFADCKFHKTSVFHNITGNISSSINFESCLFEKYIQFNGTNSSQFGIDNVEFKKIVSFQETYFDIFFIDRTVFEKGALFDDIQIKKIDDCDRRTIRTIKQELQKSENKIDFSRFRVYEFNAYRKDIRKKLIEFKKDKNRFYHRKREPIQISRDLFILNISDIVSEYGTDWKRAIKFTLITGLFWFCVLYRIENSGTFNPEKINSFFVGAFRFFLVTDFFNPLENDRTYIENGWSWLIFILGKIFIAFGIYEMIQSFRKFKA